ncbi:DUF2063 domain-containing protein [Altererythrobacter sp. BO-6]|uniref:HvfC/BufC family peptide modification chaperone n=1 Tax=Altererythrobacter sp. BO-6 TaxID=2604537 RepID=UPI0013E1EEE0|nr:putative DNA-binding domain-containing protein [Altererythrobacter sp. BO-6]QIG53835.1 DUF2063 domain-containing protein [Altererythrobacter sp. BO-6]
MSEFQTLAQRQAAFMAQVLDEEAPLPTGWTARHAAGIAVYRGNYRAGLVEALKNSFERTARWVGDDAFQRAAAHHIITHPPHSWTLDDVGAGFDGTCAELFANDPEVEELAWLEWAMLEAFTAANVEPLDAARFASLTAGFGDAEWAGLRIRFLPGAAAREVRHDLRAIWNVLGEDVLEYPDAALDAPASVLVWREGERSTFMMGSAEEARAFAALDAGMAYGDLCLMLAGDAASDDEVEQAAMRAGTMLGRWLGEGLISEVGL